MVIQFLLLKSEAGHIILGKRPFHYICSFKLYIVKVIQSFYYSIYPRATVFHQPLSLIPLCGLYTVDSSTPQPPGFYY